MRAYLCVWSWIHIDEHQGSWVLWWVKIREIEQAITNMGKGYKNISNKGD